jgi:hypothetical protein
MELLDLSTRNKIIVFIVRITTRLPFRADHYILCEYNLLPTTKLLIILYKVVIIPSFPLQVARMYTL